MCQKALVVGRQYLRTRDLAVAGKAGQLSSPALNYTADNLEHDLAFKYSSVKRESESIAAMETTARKRKREQEEEEEEKKRMLEVAESYDELTESGNTYHVGDVVYLTSRLATTYCHVTVT